MDMETKQMFNLILNKLDSIDNKVDKLEKRMDSLEHRMDAMERSMDSIEHRMDSMEKRQDEMYIIMRSLEENVKVTRAEQESKVYDLAEIQGKLNTVSDKVEDHAGVIAQIRAIS